ncbi:MAG: dihydrolipoamide acetyltransferase, partial [Myxococcota bacterium]
ADETYNLKVRQLESRINELKEQIFRSKAKLTLLTEQVTGGLGSGGGAVIILRDDMGSAFLLREVACFLDGAPLWTAYNEQGVQLRGSNAGEQVLYDGSLVEGSHTLSVQLVYTGNGSGVFSYLAGYTFRLKNSHTFEVEPGKVVKLVAVGFDKGGITTELTDRPALRFDTETKEEPRAKASGP